LHNFEWDNGPDQKPLARPDKKQVERKTRQRFFLTRHCGDFMFLNVFKNLAAAASGEGMIYKITGEVRPLFEGWVSPMWIYGSRLIAGMPYKPFGQDSYRS